MHVSGDSKRRGWLGSHDSLCGRRQGVELRFHMDEGLPTVRGDTGRIKQVPCQTLAASAFSAFREILRRGVRGADWAGRGPGFLV